MKDQTAAETHDCGGCALGTVPTERRAFLRDAALGVAALLAAMGMPRELAAMPAAFLTPTSRSQRTRSYTVPSADGVQVDRESQVILVRWQQAVYCFALSCPHQNTALRWVEADRRFQCPKHKSRYQPDGTFISGRATRSMDRHGIARNGGDVVVDLETVHKQDADPASWAAAMVSLA